MAQLRWYLEEYLVYPYPPETAHAERVLDALRNRGTQAFNALFNTRDAGRWFESAATLQIRSNDPRTLSWPWEALCNPEDITTLLKEHAVPAVVLNACQSGMLGVVPENPSRLMRRRKISTARPVPITNWAGLDKSNGISRRRGSGT